MAFIRNPANDVSPAKQRLYCELQLPHRTNRFRTPAMLCFRTMNPLNSSKPSVFSYPLSQREPDSIPPDLQLLKQSDPLAYKLHLMSEAERMRQERIKVLWGRSPDTEPKGK